MDATPTTAIHEITFKNGRYVLFCSQLFLCALEQELDRKLKYQGNIICVPEFKTT